MPIDASPQLEHTEIDGIVKRACRYAPGTAASHVNGEVHAELDTFALAVYGAEWRGKAGKTDRDVLLALIGYAPRPDRLRQDCVLRLAAGGIVVYDATTDTVRLSDGWQQNFEIERGLKGEIKREERQRQRHAAKRYWFHLSRIESERADG